MSVLCRGPILVHMASNPHSTAHDKASGDAVSSQKAEVVWIRVGDETATADAAQQLVSALLGVSAPSGTQGD